MARRGDDGSSPDGLIRGGQATGVGVASLYSAAVSYVVLVIAARTLPPADNTLFLTYWALLFGTFGVVTGLNAESGRSSFGDGDVAPRTSTRVVLVAIAFGTATCLVLGLSSWAWATTVLDAGHAWLVGVVVVAGAAFSGHLAVLGVLASRRQWRALIGVTSADASVRLVAVLVALVVFDSLGGLAVASAVSAGAWMLLLVRRDVRSALAARGDAPVRQQVSHFAHACLASAASAALAVGFPVLIRVTAERSEYVGAAGLLLAISLTRAPLMVPLMAYQGVALTHFLRRRDDGIRALYPIVGAVLLVTALGAAAAAAVGPPLFGLLLGDEYAAGAGLLAGLTAGAGMLALVTLTGACCLAVGGHRAYAAGWVVATVVAVVILMTPLELSQRTVISLVVAPVCGALVHATAVRANSSTAGRQLTAR